MRTKRVQRLLWLWCICRVAEQTCMHFIEDHRTITPLDTSNLFYRDDAIKDRRNLSSIWRVFLTQRLKNKILKGRGHSECRTLGMEHTRSDHLVPPSVVEIHKGQGS